MSSTTETYQLGQSKLREMLLKADLQFDVHVDYVWKTYCNGDNDSCCDPSDYCRCGTIKNPVVCEDIVIDGVKYAKVNIDNFINSQLNEFTGEYDYQMSRAEQICLYAVYSEPVLVSVDNIKVNVTGGYYGQEIDSVVAVNCPNINKVVDDIVYLMQMETIESKLQWMFNKLNVEFDCSKYEWNENIVYLATANTKNSIVEETTGDEPSGLHYVLAVGTPEKADVIIGKNTIKEIEKNNRNYSPVQTSRRVLTVAGVIGEPK